MHGASSSIGTVQEYLDSLPREKKDELAKVRELVLANLPEGYEEAFEWGMITWHVPLSRFADTYNGKPLMYAALTAQKNHFSLYLTGIYVSETAREAFETAYRNSGKKLDASKSCVRFKKSEDLPNDVIASTVQSMSVDEFVEQMKKMQSRPKKKTTSA